MAVVGLGIDLVDIARAERLLSVHGQRALERLLAPSEMAYVNEARFPARHLAVRIAAKEAVYKALQVLPDSRGVGWREIEVVRGTDGRPTVALHGKAAEVCGVRRLHIALTHSDLTAAASVILEEI